MQKLPADLEQEIATNWQNHEKTILGKYAYKTINAKRRMEESSNFRPAFTRDADRILHSFSFARFFDKTQVFFWIKSDIHQHRMLHVQFVSKIARFIAQVLNLNEDLAEAIALGHDIGHVPMGHDGESILNKLCIEHGIGQFHHNYESVWFLQEIEMQNLTLPVLDGILCHNGEKHHRILKPEFDHLTWENHDIDMNAIINGTQLDPLPKTLEACLVRFVDTISYISRDVLDAENLGFLKFSDIPESVKKTLGTTNRDIINSLIVDLISNSYGKDFIAHSEPVFNALEDLYRFNYHNIYSNHEKMAHIPTIEQAFRSLWEYYEKAFRDSKKESKIFIDHILLNLRQIMQRKPMIKSIENYVYAQQDPRIIVRDFIAGMTDMYFWVQVEKVNPNIKFNLKPIF